MRVTVDGQPVLTVPRCENEVIVLLSKLEALGAIPFAQFSLMEHTPKSGIDALADFQIVEQDVSTQLGAVELEYEFENFFDHQHAPEQVNLVVCWDFRDGEALDPRLIKREEYLYTF